MINRLNNSRWFLNLSFCIVELAKEILKSFILLNDFKRSKGMT